MVVVAAAVRYGVERGRRARPQAELRRVWQTKLQRVSPSIIYNYIVRLKGSYNCLYTVKPVPLPFQILCQLRSLLKSSKQIKKV